MGCSHKSTGCSLGTDCMFFFEICRHTKAGQVLCPARGLYDKLLIANQPGQVLTSGFFLLVRGIEPRQDFHILSAPKALVRSFLRSFFPWPGTAVLVYRSRCSPPHCVGKDLEHHTVQLWTGRVPHIAYTGYSLQKVPSFTSTDRNCSARVPIAVLALSSCPYEVLL